MTRLRFAVVGSPIAHSRSPAMHGAAYRALGLAHVYERLETSEAELASRVEAVRAGELEGINVTVPHKTKVLGLVDELDVSARAAGAANTLVRVVGEHGRARVRAYNTDVPALASEIARLAALRVDGAMKLAGRPAIVVGSGGAARAAILALAKEASRIVVRARAFADPVAARAFEASIEGAAELAPGFVVASSFDRAGLDRAGVDGVEPHVGVIVQATTCGMPGGPPGGVARDAIAWDDVAVDAIALDVVYASPSSAPTPFLDAAGARGLVHAGGLGMLVEQGALAFERWLGVAPPRDVMRAAVVSAT